MWDDKKSPTYDMIVRWVWENPTYPFYVIAGQQTNTEFVDFCDAVLSQNCTPVIITNVSSIDKPYSAQIQASMRLSPRVRVYEAAKMAMTGILRAKAKLFVKTNGGIIWTPQ